MRRTISLMLALMLFVQIFGMSTLHLYANSENSSIDITKELYVLNRLGIVDVDETDDTTAPVTRAAFATYVASAMKLDTTGTERFFTDVPAQHWALGSIGALAKNGIIDGTPSNRFEPERAISYSEACKILVSAAGYNAYVEHLGGSLTEYIRFANRIDIDLTPVNSNSLNLEEVIYMLYHTMAAPMVYEYGVIDDTLAVNVREDKTLFLVYHDVYITKGRVETVYGKSIYNADAIEQTDVIIGGTKYFLDAGYEIRNLFGYSVEYLYIKKSSDVYGTVIYAEKDNKNKVKIIAGEDIVSFDSGNYELVYYKGNKSTASREVILRGARIVLNGRILSGSISEQMAMFANKSRKGTVTLISTEDKGIDLVIIDSKRLYTASSYHTEDKVLYSFYDDLPIQLKEYDVINIHTPEGVASAMPTAFPVSLGIAESDDGSTVDITIYTEQMEKKIDSIGNERTVVIEGAKYKIDNTLYPEISSTLKAGQMYRIILDEFGEIVMLISLTDEMQLGYLRAVADVGGSFDRDYKVSIFMTDLAFHEYDIADRVKIDGITYKVSDYQNLFAAFPGQKMITDERVTLERQLIRFSLNSDGEMNVIDTYELGASEDPDNTLDRRSDGSKELYHAKNPKRLGLTDIYDTNTSFFMVPETTFGDNAADEIKNYAIGAAYLNDLKLYMAETYYLGESSPVALAVVCMMPAGNLCEDVFMFDSLSEAYDEVDGAVDQINGWLKGAVVTYNISDAALDSVKELSEGDLYYVELDVAGKTVISITKMIDAEEKIFNTDPASRENVSNDGNGGLNKYWWSGNFAYPEQWRVNMRQLIKIYPYNISGTYVRGSYTMENVRREIIDDVTNLNGLPITVYDPENERTPIYKGTLADIKTYQNDTEECSMVVIHTRHQELKQIFVYR